MKQWMTYETTDEYIKEEYRARSLRVFYCKEDFAVVFNAKGDAAFTRNEAISVLKDILKTLEDDETGCD